MTLSALVVVISLSSLTNMAMAMANKEMYQAVHKQFKEYKGKSLGIVLTNLAFSIVTMCLWIALAFVEQDWRFAAITLIPFTTHWLTRLALR